MSSLTFGPKWVRDLSSGDTGAAAPPNTPPPRKYKLAEFRYGREEMLALVSETYELPLGLKDFEDIINERPVPPLAIIPLSEEEERCQMGGVNSLLVLKMTGRGAPGFRGRGGVRGRGRGRGSDYQISRSGSTSEEGYNQRPWSESGHSRGGGNNYHRPLGRGESVDGTVRPGYESRQRLSSDGSYSNRPTEYWRSNSQEATTSTPQTPTEEGEGWPYKPWTGKKGSADNNRNWRDPKEPEPGETKPKSWNRSNSTSDHMSNSSLPEWCNDDEDSIPGSFDASGQFRSFNKTNGTLEDSQLDSKDNDESKLDNTLTDNKLNNSSNTSTELKKTNEQKQPDSMKPSERQDSKLSPAKEGTPTPLEDKEKLLTEKNSDKPSLINSTNTAAKTEIQGLQNVVDPSADINNVSKETVNFMSSSPQQQPGQNNFSSPLDNVVSEIPNDLHQVTADSVDVNISNHGSHPDDDDELNIEHITSMVEKLGEDSDEEEMLQHQRQPHVTDATAALDPSIVFAKKAEPGKTINGLQDWIYRDPQGEIQGPFTNDEMLEWFKAGYFTIGLLVRRVCDEIFLPLGDVMKLWGRIPFSAKDQPLPITNQVLLQHQHQQQQSQIQRLIAQQQQQQQLAQQQQQQQMREALLQQLQVDGKRPNDLGLSPEVSVWGDVIPPNQQQPNSNASTSPWNTPDQGTWNANKKSPPNAINLRQIEEEQQRQAKMKESPQMQQSSPQPIEENMITREPEKSSPSPPAEVLPETHEDVTNNGNKIEPKTEKPTIPEKEDEVKETSVENTPTKKKNKKKNKNKENAEESMEEKKKQENDQKQKEKEELQRKALEALKQQQQLQQQQKLAEQRMLEEQNRREEEIRQKQQAQQQQIQQQMLYAKYQQDQQRKQQQQQQQQQAQQQQQQQQQQTMASTWNRVTPTTSAPSLAEIQRIEERKQAELHEHMKAIHHEQLIQQQQQQQQQRARWAQQQGFHQQQQRVKSLVEIQAEEAKKALQMQQQQQMKQQQIRQQQQQQNYNPLPWNAAGQPIHAKPNKNDYNASFWDEVAGITSPRVNGASNNNQQQQQQQQQKGQQNRKNYNDFPPMSSGNKSSNKRDTKEQEIISRIFQVPTPSSDFINWVERNLPAVKKAIDVPTVVAFLQDIDSPYDIHEYMRSYLGDSTEQKAFVREFLCRRNKTKKDQDAMNMPGQQGVLSGTNGVSMADDEGFEESKRNKKKKNKMQKVDPNLLGFQCNAAPEMMNRAGEIESISEALARGKK